MGVIPQPVPNTFTPGNCSGYTAVSEIFTFNVDSNCSRSATQKLQLMFLNRYGVYDYYTFTCERSEGMAINRQTYNQWNTDWGSSNPNKTQYSRGLTDSVVDMEQTVIVNSGFINSPDMLWLEELYTSNEVYEVQTDGGIYPINIVNTEFVRKIQGNKTIVNLELTYRYSNNIQLLHK